MKFFAFRISLFVFFIFVFSTKTACYKIFTALAHCPMTASLERFLPQLPGYFPYPLLLQPLYVMQRPRPRRFAPPPRDQLGKCLLGLSRFLPNVRRNRSCATSSMGIPPRYGST